MLNYYLNTTFSVQFSLLSEYVISGSLDGEINILRIDDRKLIARYHTKHLYIYNVKWKNAGDKIGFCLFNTKVIIVKT